jgi:hypothetical protein
MAGKASTKNAALSKEDKALFTAAKRKSAKSLDASIAAGASLAARDEQGFTALHLVSREHELGLALHLVARGADPWAGSYGPADGFRPISFFGPEEAAQLAAAAAQVGIISPEGERLVVLATLPERGVVTYERYPDFPDGSNASALRKVLRAGGEVSGLWPAGAKLAPSKFRDPSDVALRDLLEGGPTGFLVSAALAEHLRALAANGVVPVESFELLPIALLDEGGAMPEERFALHVRAQPALELSRAFPKYNLINKAQVDDVAVHALRLEDVAQLVLFRAAEYPEPVFIARALLDELSTRFSGLSMRPLRR